MCWYDDWGWWGIAFSKAFYPEYQALFGTLGPEFKSKAALCWKIMHTGKPDVKPYMWKGAPKVWAYRNFDMNPDYFDSPEGWAVPRFNGGVWQYDLFHTKRPKPPECSPSNPSDPKKCKLGPFQNTVMNGLYLILASRLANHGVGTEQPMQNEFKFLNDWFKLNGDESLLQRFPDGSLLVRERVPTYASRDGGNTYPRVEGYKPESQWGGDQGLILGGLLDYLYANPSAPSVQDQMVAIIRGVLLHMVDEKGVVRPFSEKFDVHGDSDDYSCGSGVFWRYMFHAFFRHAVLRQEIVDLVKKNPTGNAVYLSAQNPYAYAPQNNELFKEFNALSVLLTAIQILKAANGQ